MQFGELWLDDQPPTEAEYAQLAVLYSRVAADVRMEAVAKRPDLEREFTAVKEIERHAYIVVYAAARELDDSNSSLVFGGGLGIFMIFLVMTSIGANRNDDLTGNEQAFMIILLAGIAFLIWRHAYRTLKKRRKTLVDAWQLAARKFPKERPKTRKPRPIFDIPEQS